MKSFKLVCLWVLFLPSVLMARTVVVEGKINWKAPTFASSTHQPPQKLMAFDGVTYDTKKDRLGVYTQKVSLKKEEITSVSIVDVQYVAAKEDELKGIAGLSYIQENLELSYKNATQKKQQYGFIQFIPIIYNKNTGNYQKVVSYKIQLTTKPKNTLQARAKSFGTSSVLASGDWYKIGVLKEGVYKISYAFLKNLGLDIDNLSPNDFKLYGNGGKMLPALNTVPRTDDLKQNAVHVEGGTDGVFNIGDYVLFYGQSPHTWEYDDGTSKFKHALNKFSDTTYYFITFSNTGETAKRISTQSSQANHNQTVNTFNAHQYYERDLLNLIKSGNEWFGEVYDAKSSYDFSFSFPYADLSTPLQIDYSVAARSGSNSEFKMSVLNATDVLGVGKVSISNYQGTYAKMASNSFSTNLTSDLVNITLSYNKPSSVSIGWLNEIELNARRKLTMHGNQLFYRDVNTVGAGNVSEFRLSGPSNAVDQIWDITDPFNVKKQQIAFAGNTYSYKLTTSILREFVAFNTNYDTELFAMGKVANQNLHGIAPADMIIVSHPDFLDEAALLADFHKENDDLRTVIVTPEQIYNEFSSGGQDLIAIRDFVRMLYEKATTSADLPQYLLLFGDGSYDNKNRVVGNTNFIPTYQSPQSMHVALSYVSDDYYGLLDPSEGTWSSAELVDIAIGRLPVKSKEEAENVINKIFSYNTSNSMNEWRNNFVFVGDDDDGNLHMEQSDQLATMVDTAYKAYNVDKIFLDAFEQQSTPGGNRYPAVKKAINTAVESGSLLINYTGHGGEVGWADERILTVQDVNGWENTSAVGFPLFVTATCEFSRFDDPKRTTAGELVLLNQNGGIGLFTTVRLVSAGPNFTLNKAFYEEVFTPVDGKLPTMGELFMSIKNKVTSNNTRNFTLLGDPALRLAYPTHNVKTTQINGVSTSLADTIKSLSKVTIKGEIQDKNGNKLSNFNGIIRPIVFDKAKQINTLNNDGDGVFSFTQQTSKLFKGKASVVNGEFSYSFVVPKDISYSYGQGKLSYYAENKAVDANGYHTNFYIGGTANDYAADDVGPEIDLFMNDESFVFGGITDNQPVFLANISDLHGINMVGNGIGHDIVAVLDDNTDEPLILNDYYEADLNSYQSGKIMYPLSDLKEGRHKLSLKVWDVYNNSSEASIEFVVVNSEEIQLERVYNYPNPFTTYTEFWFEHNQPGKQLFAQVQIFTVAGKLVKTLEQHILTEGYRSTSITWNGLDEYGDRIGRGVYVYRLKVRNENFTVAEKYQKLVILR